MRSAIAYCHYDISRREDPLMTSSSSSFNFVLHTFSFSPPLGCPLPPFYFLPLPLVVLPFISSSLGCLTLDGSRLA